MTTAGSRPTIPSVPARRSAGKVHDRQPQYPGRRPAPQNGELWTHEHGPQGGDEINIIRAGRQLRLAGDHLRQELRHRNTDRRGNGKARHGPARAPMDTVDCALGNGFLHRRPLPGMAWRSLRRRPARPDAGPLEARGFARRPSGTAFLKADIGRIRDVRNGPDGFILTDSARRHRAPRPRRQQSADKHTADARHTRRLDAELTSPWYACMAGTNAASPRCQALQGEVGHRVSCAVYRQRPSPCREVQPGDAQCSKARLAWRLPVLVVPSTEKVPGLAAATLPMPAHPARLNRR
jgi:hypothetical protein